MKFVKALVLIMLALFLCVGCGKDNFNKKIMLVVEAPTFNDNGFNRGLWNGIMHLNLKTKVATLDNPKGKSFLDVTKDAIKEKPGLLFLSSNEDANSELEHLVQEHPEIMFVMLDKESSFAQPNYMSVYVQSNEGAFLAGYVAAQMSKTHKVGFIGGANVRSIDRFKYGYLAGVDYGAHEKGIQIEKDVRMAGTFFDQSKGERLAKAMYDDGCDVIFAAAGQATLGVIAEASAANKFVIGVDVDQQDLAPKQVLCSALSDYSVIIRAVADLYLQQERVRPLDSTGIAIGASGLAINNRIVPYNVVSSEHKLEENIKDGLLKVPSSQDDYFAFKKQLGVK